MLDLQRFFNIFLGIKLIFSRFKLIFSRFFALKKMLDCISLQHIFINIFMYNILII